MPLMITRSILNEAVNKKLIQENQLEPLYEFIKQKEHEGSYINQVSTATESIEEPLRFVRSFGDVFITLGIILLVVAFNLMDFPDNYNFIAIGVFVVLAEWLVRGRRLVLPGIAILLSILYFTNNLIGIDTESSSIDGLAILSLTSLIFYLRYKMPFSLFPFAAGLVAIAIMQIGIDIIKVPIVLSGFGVVILAVALWFDIHDTRRKTHMSDSAFWLHLLSAPLIVHGVMATMLTSDGQLLALLGKEIVILFFFVLFFLLALLIDRRAMLVATQLYVIYSLSQLLMSTVSRTENVVIYSLVLFSVFVIYFGTYWYRTRDVVFGFVANSWLANYLPAFGSQK